MVSVARRRVRLGTGLARRGVPDGAPDILALRAFCRARSRSYASPTLRCRRPLMRAKMLMQPLSYPQIRWAMRA